MAYNWLMMTSSAGGLDIATDKTKNKPKAEQETAQPTAARFNYCYLALFGRYSVQLSNNCHIHFLLPDVKSQIK